MINHTLGPLPIDKIEGVVQQILDTELPHIIAFSGDLGAGKTTLIRELLKRLGTGEMVNSPTFGIINEYRTAENRKVCHTDWYRLKNAEELYDTGIEEYLHDPDCLVMIEWPEVGLNWLKQEDFLHIHIEHSGAERIYHFERPHS
jgi:tRNA threonylcarbamoyladenosine biosynthesis protein TsaE